MQGDIYTGDYNSYSMLMDPALVNQISQLIGIFMCLYIVLVVVLAIPLLAGMWKIFVKAGQPGWASLIPIYNTIVLLEIINRPGWWLIMMFIPFINIVFSILVNIELARAFGKSEAYAIGLGLMPLVFYPMLGFGNAVYTKPVV